MPLATSGVHRKLLLEGIDPALLGAWNVQSSASPTQLHPYTEKMWFAGKNPASATLPHGPRAPSHAMGTTTRLEKEPFAIPGG